MNQFAERLAAEGLELRRTRPEILQVNAGKLCNLTCTHCHVNAGPKRKEIMTRETIDRVIDWLAKSDIPTVDLTGGAPEMIPDFRYFIERVRALHPWRKIIDRCNLTILLEPSYTGLAKFLAANKVEIIASMPCYTPENVNAQRGEGVFEGSIKALQLLNSLGYGIDVAGPASGGQLLANRVTVENADASASSWATQPVDATGCPSGAKRVDLPLHLVYNPVGAYLPGPQAELEGDYKRELKKHFGIVFNKLYTITNLPIARFAAYLRHNNQLDEYMELLTHAFNPATIAGLMCRNTISVGWRGEVYDCDFNQQLDMQWSRNGGIGRLFLWDIDPNEIGNREIMTGDHCFGCTAGAGSSCGGAIV